MSVQGDIEQALVDILLSIDGTTQTFPGLLTPYTFHTHTSTVNIYDDTISVVKDKLKGGVNYTIEMVEENNTDYQLGSNCYANMISYTITAEAKNTGIGIAKRLINEKMSLILEDIKYVLFRYNTLNNTCFGVSYLNSSRQYTSGNDMINSGKLIINIQVQYGQRGSNPSISYNNNYMN